jgi:hypothetical protein
MGQLCVLPTRFVSISDWASTWVKRAVLDEREPFQPPGWKVSTRTGPFEEAGEGQLGFSSHSGWALPHGVPGVPMARVARRWGIPPRPAAPQGKSEPRK